MQSPESLVCFQKLDYRPPKVSSFLNSVILPMLLLPVIHQGSRTDLPFLEFFLFLCKAHIVSFLVYVSYITDGNLKKLFRFNY